MTETYGRFRSDSLPFGDCKDGKKSEEREQRSEEPFPRGGHLCREKLGQRAENEAEHNQIGRRGLFLHGALDQSRRQENTAHRADDEGGEGEECHDIQRIDSRGQLFVYAEHEEHLRNADAGQNEGDGDDDAAEKLNEDTADDGERARAADLENAFGDQTDEQSADNTEDGVKEDGGADLFDLRRTEDHRSAARHRAEEEITRGNGEMRECKGDELGKEEESECRADEKFGKEDEAFLAFSFLQNTVDGGDEAVVNTEDHCHRAARNARHGHRTADPRAASRREKGVLQILFFHAKKFLSGNCVK